MGIGRGRGGWVGRVGYISMGVLQLYVSTDR